MATKQLMTNGLTKDDALARVKQDEHDAVQVWPTICRPDWPIAETENNRSSQKDQRPQRSEHHARTLPQGSVQR